MDPYNPFRIPVAVASLASEDRLLVLLSPN